jgi:predicted aspartyl protease
MIGSMMRSAALALTLTLLTTPALAEIVKYTDDSGINHYVDGMQSVPQQYRARAVPLGLSNDETTVPLRAPDPAKTSSSVRGGATITYAPGQRIMVNATVNGSTPAQLLLDTGADRTMINPRVLAAAGVSLARPVGSAMVSGVGGSQEMQFVTINSLDVAGASVGRLIVAAHGVEGAGDGLLGRDFLDNFSVNIDAAKGVVTLSPK